MATKTSNTHRFAAAEELLDTLLGKRGNTVEQFVKTHRHQIADLLAGGLSASQVAKLFAVPLSASKRRVLGALKNAGFVTESDVPSVFQEPAGNGTAQPAPSRSGGRGRVGCCQGRPCRWRFSSSKTREGGTSHSAVP